MNKSTANEMIHKIIPIAGLNSVLFIELKPSEIVRKMLEQGLDAFGFIISNLELNSEIYKNKYKTGDLCCLPFENNRFETVVVENILENYDAETIKKIVSEIYRICSKNLILKISTNSDKNKINGPREFWETILLKQSFIKHPKYYLLNEYEILNSDGDNIYIYLEKLRENISDHFSLDSLEEERGLHMDMLRDVGERSDAHVVRYHWASKYIKPGDRVLDAACGLGYGGHVIRNLSKAAEVIGVDGSDRSISYAKEIYGNDSRAQYICGMLPEALNKYPDASFEVVISFETLEHVENPQELLHEFHRVLVPGGRIIVSVPNDWSDESGEDPNPYHLHVYDWVRLKNELSSKFIIENAYAQDASQHKVDYKNSRWEPCQRALFSVDPYKHPNVFAEWWLMVGMKSPLEKSDAPYMERVFYNISNSDNPLIQYEKYYENPWIIHAMVNSEYRLNNKIALESLAKSIISEAKATSNDYAAALCVLAYLSLEDERQGLQEELLPCLKEFAQSSPADIMGHRWKISILFVYAKLLQSRGRQTDAMYAYISCSKENALLFSVHLATKTTDASFCAGEIAYATKNYELAKASWKRGVEIGSDLLNVKIEDILINANYPNLFNHGDGVREYTAAWDNISKCTNGLHILNENFGMDSFALTNSFQKEYYGVTKDLLQTREYLRATQNELDIARKEKNSAFDTLSKDLIERTEELVETREVLRDRTIRLEAITKMYEEEKSKEMTGINSLSFFKKILKKIHLN